MSTYDPPVGLLLVATSVVWLTAAYARPAANAAVRLLGLLARRLDAWSQRRTDRMVAHVLDADEAFWTLPDGVRGEVPEARLYVDADAGELLAEEAAAYLRDRA